MSNKEEHNPRGGDRALVIVGDDLASLVACTLETQRSEVDSRGGPVLWAPRDEAVGGTRRIGEHFGLEIAPRRTGTGEVDQSVMLLEAGRVAIELGAGRVVWPVHAGVPGRPEELDLDAASREADRALLVTRLLALDAESHGVQSIRIEPPLADLTDRQLVELALDLDAPIRLCGWWSDVGSDEHARWMGALDACGAHEHLS